MEPRYVRCKVSPGLFAAEFYVVVQGSSAYVDRSQVQVLEQPQRGAEVEGQVLTYVIDAGEGKEEALVQLPGEPVVGGLRTWVPKSLFASA